MQGDEDRTVGASDPALGERLPQFGEQLGLFAEGHVLVGHVVAVTTEGIGGVDGAPLGAGQRAKGVIEVLRAALGYAATVLVSQVNLGCH